MLIGVLGRFHATLRRRFLGRAVLTFADTDKRLVFPARLDLVILTQHIRHRHITASYKRMGGKQRCVSLNTSGFERICAALEAAVDGRDIRQALGQNQEAR